LNESQTGKDGKDKTDSVSGTLNNDNSPNDNGDTDTNAGDSKSDDVSSADNAGRERSGNRNAGKVAVAGEKVENAARSNPIGFDVKPYLAIAILLILAVTTMFAAGPTAHKPKGSIGGKHYKRPGMS
jgi:hypothetical protein